MILIVGGIEQGKKEWAKQHFGLADTQIADGAALDVSSAAEADFAPYRALYGLQTLLEHAASLSDNSREALLNTLLGLPKDFVVICDEVGLGLVPQQHEDREYRELVGRVCCALAAEAQEVWRVFCGIGQRLK